MSVFLVVGVKSSDTKGSPQCYRPQNLMIGSLAYGGRQLNEPRYTVAAGKAADFILKTMYKDDRLLRSDRNGMAARVLVRLAQVAGEQRYLEIAKTTLEAFLAPIRCSPRGAESLILATVMRLHGVSPASGGHGDVAPNTPL